MRTLSTAGLAALSGSSIGVTLLIEMDLDSTVYLSMSGVDFEYGGHTWVGAASVGSIDEVRDSAGERQSLKMTLSSVPTSLLSLALGSPVRGKSLKIYEALLDPGTYAVLDAPLVWSGSLDAMSIEENGQSGTISVTAEHRGTTFARVKPLRYTDGDQQRLYAGDRSMQFVVSQANHRDVWPAAAFFRQ